MSIPININRDASPEQIYRQLMRLWRLHLSVSEPDLEQLRQVHRALSIQEVSLYQTRTDLCLENLQQRLRDAMALGQRDLEIVHEYSDTISGVKARRPALDQMMAAAQRASSR
jgi:Resolvase, N terminal domain